MYCIPCNTILEILFEFDSHLLWKKLCHFVKKVILFSFLIFACRGDLGGTNRGKDELVDVGRSSLEEVEPLLDQGSMSNLKDEVS